MVTVHRGLPDAQRGCHPLARSRLATMVDVSAIGPSVSGSAAVLVAPRASRASLSPWQPHTRGDPGCRPPVLPGTETAAPPAPGWLPSVRVKRHQSAPRLGS